tara:strand:- start:402 stop:1136 length:735 start_codon:yes stop_codon:yes gene_type:complete
MSIHYNPTITTNGLIFALDAASRLSYPGTGSVITGLSSGVDAALVNSVSFSPDNYGYFALDGGDDYISTNKVDLSNVKQMTACMMLKAGSSTSAQMLLEFSTNYNSFDDGFFVSYYDSLFGYSSSIMVGRKGDVGRNIRTFNNDILSGNAWTYLSIVYDGNETKSQRCQMYVNSIKQTPSQPHSVNWDDDNTNNLGNHGLYIGARSGAVAPFSGDIACCHVYDRVLSSKEMYANYSAIKTRFGL